MRVRELSRYGIPDEILDMWARQMGENLLPVQERAIRRYGVLDGRSLIISSPTSSGKTFVGEMAAVKTVMENRKAVYMVPMRALAEEKYQDFKGKYEGFGVKVVVSSADHREYDEEIANANFGIAVMVYEKMAQMLVRNPAILQNISLVVVDELQQLMDRERGPKLEVTLTQIALYNPRPQILGLSAVLKEADLLARWLHTDFMSHDKRPVELYEGVLHRGIFRYRTHNSFEEGEEQMVDVPEVGTWDEDGFIKVMLPNALRLLEEGEQVLAFLPSKREAMALAQMLKERAGLEEARGAISELEVLEDTSLKRALMECLRSSVAFHHADLSQEERQVVEKYVRSGEIKAVCSTTTLSMGVNLPCSVVFIDTNKWFADESKEHLVKVPISWSEYENMSGRAGRLGFGRELGRSIMVARSDFEREVLWKNYVEGNKEQRLESTLKGKGLEEEVLFVMASGGFKDAEGLAGFFMKTLLGFEASREEISKSVLSAVAKLKEHSLVAEDSQKGLLTTPVGKVVAEKGISFRTALSLSRFMEEVKGRELGELEFLHALAYTEDGGKIYVQMQKREQESWKYQHILKERFSGSEEGLNTALKAQVQSRILLAPVQQRAIKLGLLMEDWIKGKDTPTMEKDFQSYYGTIATAALSMSWLADASHDIAKALGLDSKLLKRIRGISDRLIFGVEEKGLPIARLRVKGLGRAGVKALLREGIDSIEAIKEAPLSLLARILPLKVAEELKGRVSETKASTESSAAPEGPAFQCRDEIEITGRTFRGRTQVAVNGYMAGLTTRSLELLLLLGIALKRDGVGWVDREKIGDSQSASQRISRLRAELGPYTLKKDGSIIENDRTGRYRLSIPPQNLRLELDTLQKHESSTVRDLIKEL